jgi:hypothetical protein
VPFRRFEKDTYSYAEYAACKIKSRERTSASVVHIESLMSEVELVQSIAAQLPGVERDHQNFDTCTSSTILLPKQLVRLKLVLE